MFRSRRKDKDKKPKKKKWDILDDDEAESSSSKASASFLKLKRELREEEDRIRRNEARARSEKRRRGDVKDTSKRSREKKVAKKSRMIVFLDIGIERAILGTGLSPIGRLEIELFTAVAPKTCENFRSLCTGECGRGQQRLPLDYTSSIFHRIIPGFMAQGGDITHEDGTGGESIYGRTFDDEKFVRKHDAAGLLSMANAGKNTNGSQFFLLFKSAPHLDGKHVVFGKITKGIGVLRKIESFGTESGKPKNRVEVMNSGELGKGRDRGCLLTLKKRVSSQVHVRKNPRGFKHSSMGSKSRPIYM